MTVLKPGDLVILKSGGPVMTVDTVNTDIFDDDKITGILCAWFVATNWSERVSIRTRLPRRHRQTHLPRRRKHRRLR